MKLGQKSYIFLAPWKDWLSLVCSTFLSYNAPTIINCHLPAVLLGFFLFVLMQTACFWETNEIRKSKHHIWTSPRTRFFIFDVLLTSLLLTVCIYINTGNDAYSHCFVNTAKKQYMEDKSYFY